MKYPNTCFAMLALVAVAPAAFSTASAQYSTNSNQPVVLTPPAVPDGSNASRAPLPAARPADDINPPNGLAIDDNLPPNTPATNIERAPEARFAVLQPSAAPTEPMLTPTGRTTTYAQFTASREPIVITPPAVPNGSNASRAPLPAARPADDVNPPNALAIDDNVPPNTRATNIERAPETRVAVMQPAPSTTTAVVVAPAPASTVTVLTPTGRSTTGVAAALNATQLETTLRGADFNARTQLISDIEAAMKSADGAMRSVRATMSEMSASGRAQFKTADDEVKRAERALRDSLKDARKATQQEWDAARAKLASDFQAYSSALTAIDAATGAH